MLVKLDGDDLETHYSHTLEELGKQPGLIGVIFRKAQNKIQDPAKLCRLIADLIDKEEWSPLDTDVKGDAYEGLLQKNAEDVKGDAGQYFTPRPLIQAIVDVMQPMPGEVVCDPADVQSKLFFGGYSSYAPLEDTAELDASESLTNTVNPFSLLMSLYTSGL